MQGISASLQDEACAATSQDTPDRGSQDAASRGYHCHTPCQARDTGMSAQPQTSALTPTSALAAAPAASAPMLTSSWTSISKPDGFIQITTHKPSEETPGQHDLQGAVVTGLSPGPMSFTSDCIQAARPDNSSENRIHQQCNASTSSTAQQQAFGSAAAAAAGADCMLAAPSQHGSRAAELVPPLAAEAADIKPNAMQAAQDQTGSKHSGRSNPISVAMRINPFSSRSRTKQQPGLSSHSMTAGTSSSSQPHGSKSGAMSLACDSFAGFLHQQGRAEHWHSQKALWPEAASSTTEPSTSAAHHSQWTSSHTAESASPLFLSTTNQMQRHQHPSYCNLTVGMATVDPTSVPAPTQEPVPGSHAPQHELTSAMSEQTGAIHEVSTSEGAGPNDLSSPSMHSDLLTTQTDSIGPSITSASNPLVGVLGTGRQADSHATQSPADSLPTQRRADSLATHRQADSHAGQSSGLQSMQPSSSMAAASSAPDSLTGGAVLLQNPDGSLQYVMLTSEDQIAVQLSLQAKQAQQEAGSILDQVQQ